MVVKRREHGRMPRHFRRWIVFSAALKQNVHCHWLHIRRSVAVSPRTSAVPANTVSIRLSRDLKGIGLSVYHLAGQHIKRCKYTKFMRSSWPPCVADADIIFLPCDFYLSFFLLLSFFSRLISAVAAIGCLPYFQTWCGLSANLECMSEMCCTRLAENTGCKKSPSRHHRTTLLGHIFATKACIDNRKKRTC